jgi:hypothetical protein
MSSSAILRQWNFNRPIASLAINRQGDWVGAALGDGTIQFLPANDEAERPKEMELHDGVSLSLQPDADDHAFLSGGDDGKVLIVDPKLEVPTLLAEHKGKWIDHVSGSVEGGFRAYSEGKIVHLLDDVGEEKFAVHAPSSPGGLAFSPNVKRLAVTH